MVHGGKPAAEGTSAPFPGVDRPGLTGWMRPMPYLMIATSLLLSGLSEAFAHSLGRRFAAAVVVSLVAASWTWLMIRRRDGVDPSPRRLGVYFVVRLLLTAVLVMIHPWFGLYAWYGYLEAISYFAAPWTLLAISGTALLAATSYLGGFPNSAGGWLLYVLVVAGSVLLVRGFAIMTRRSVDRQREREQMMGELLDTNRRLAEALAENRGLADQVLAQAREAGVLDERARLAGEIHDTLAQALAGIITQLGAAAGAGELRSGHAPHADAALSLARSGLADARRSLQALRPEQLVDSRLSDAISTTARQWSELSGVPVAVDVTGPVVPLEANREIAALRVAQEGLTNVAKHAHAGKVGLTLTYLDDEILIDVRDDGVGFTPGSVQSPSGDGHCVGLATMRERLAKLGGELQIESAPGAGTALVARVPFVASTADLRQASSTDSVRDRP